MYHYNSHSHTHQHPNAQSASSHHSSRGRRAPRLSQHAHKQFRSVRKEEEAVVVTNFRQHFEASRSFDLDDDFLFIPNLMTESDKTDAQSMTSSASDRSSQSSGSPTSSPQSHQVAPSAFSLSSNSPPYIPASYQTQPALKLHQPAATRIRNAIPIVNPSTRMGVASPPQSISPARIGRW